MATSSIIKVSLLADASQLKRELGNAGQAVGKAGQQLSTTGKLVGAAGAAMVATKVVDFLGDATKAAMEDAKAQELLKLAINNSTDATQMDIDATEDWITQTSLATGVADDELRPALAELVRVTGDLDEAQGLMGDAMDIATAKGLPLETVTKALGKAYNGNTGALGKLNIATKNADGSTMSFEEIMAEAARTMGGATAVAAETIEGKFRRLQVAADEAQETFGAALLPVLSEIVGTASDVATVVGFLSEKISDLTGGTTDMYDIWLRLSMLKPIVELFDAAATQIDKLNQEQIDANKTLAVSSDRYDDMSTAIDEATRALEENADEVRSQMDPMFNLIDKVSDLEDAQRESGVARDEYGEGSPEHLEALRKEAGAFMNLKDAQVKAAAESGITREQFGQNLRDMKIFTQTEIALMMAEFDKLDGRTIDTTINVNLKGRGASSFSDALTGKKASGGPVRRGGTYLVGEEGPELLSMGANGNITPNDQLGGGTVIYLQVTAGMGTDGNKLGKQIVEALQAYQRSNGSIPISVRSG